MSGVVHSYCVFQTACLFLDALPVYYGPIIAPNCLSEHDELFRVTLCWLIARSWNGWEFLLRINTKHAILRRNVTQSCWGVPKAGPQHLSHLLPPMLCGFPKDPKLDHILLRTWTTQKKNGAKFPVMQIQQCSHDQQETTPFRGSQDILVVFLKLSACYNPYSCRAHHPGAHTHTHRNLRTFPNFYSYILLYITFTQITHIRWFCLTCALGAWRAQEAVRGKDG